MTEYLVTERDGPVLAISFNRPEKKNALTGAMYLAAAEALWEADSDPTIHAVVFSGAEGVFTSGNDLAEFLAMSETELALNEMEREVPAFTFVKALASCTKPIVAAVEGVALGIGATMILHCDLVYAAPGTLFRMPFVDLGLVPEGASSFLLRRRIGLAKASEFLLLCEPFGAEEAVRLGLANAIVPAPKLRGYAIDRAKKLGHKPHAALAATRRLIRGSDTETILTRLEQEAEIFAHSLRSDDARTAFTTFLSRAVK